MTLEELIRVLEESDQSRIVKCGFSDPHSFRGHYEQLAFKPTTNAKVGNMLEDARRALGSTYQGWKGGDFLMHEHTPVWIAQRGSSQDAFELTELSLNMMLGNYWYD